MDLNPEFNSPSGEPGNNPAANPGNNPSPKKLIAGIIFFSPPLDKNRAAG
jgi:hypothetical protein